MIQPHSLRPLMLFALALFVCGARNTASAETWEPVSTGIATEILISTNGGNTSADVRLTVPNAGFRVADWGVVTRMDREFSVDAKVERWTGVSAQVITTLTHVYALGALAPGVYSFAVKAYGTVLGRVQFTIATSPAPRLLTEENTERAIALESVTLMRDPFPLVATHRFSLDGVTRFMLFATDVGQVERSMVTVQAEDSRHTIYPLTVEYLGKAPGLDWLTQVVIRLPVELEGAGDVWVSINVQGVVSNRVLVSLK